MIRILIILIVLLPNTAFCQIDSMSSIITQSVTIQGKENYIKILKRTSHRYSSPNYDQRNIRLKMAGNNFIYEVLNDSNTIISSALCKPYISYDGIGLQEGDSIRENEVNKLILGEDHNLPSEIVIYNIALQKNGYYYEYYTNGDIKITGKYRKGGKVGRWIYYKPNGLISKKERYKNNKVNKSKLF